MDLGERGSVGLVVNSMNGTRAGVEGDAVNLVVVAILMGDDRRRRKPSPNVRWKPRRKTSEMQLRFQIYVALSSGCEKELYFWNPCVETIADIYIW